MRLRELLQKWGLSSLRINAGFLDAEFTPKDPAQAAAWDLYIELSTRITTQYLDPDHGDEKAALESLHVLFALTREILKNHGPGAKECAVIAIPVLNQVIRPFTAKWHRKLIENVLDRPEGRGEFRAELDSLHRTIRSYMYSLSDMAGVEDLSSLESWNDGSDQAR
jgi:hypothetical protein